MTTKAKIWTAIGLGVAAAIGGAAWYFKNKNQAPDKQADGNSTTPTTGSSTTNNTATSGSGNASHNTGVVPPKKDIDNPPPKPTIKKDYKAGTILYSSANQAFIFSEPEFSNKYNIGSISKYKLIGNFLEIAKTNGAFAKVLMQNPPSLAGKTKYVPISQITDVKN